MRNIRLGLIVAGALGIVSIGACSDDMPPGAVDGTSSSSGASSGGNDGGGVTEAGSLSDSSRVAPERLCDPLAQRSELVEEVKYGGTAPPAVGGVLTPGTYQLTFLEQYTGVDGPPPEEGGEPTGPTGQAGRVTMYVLGNAIRFVEAYGATGSLPQDTTRGVSYLVNGTTLALNEECPSAGKTSSMSFTVQGSTITLYPDANRRQLFQRLLD